MAEEKKKDLAAEKATKETKAPAKKAAAKKEPIVEYTHEKSQAWYKRALDVIPSGIYGHQGPAEGLWIPAAKWPYFSERAKGTYFWDVDGNKYIDYMCAYGPNVLGYNDPDVDAAAKEQLEKENCVTTPSYKMVELAELMVDTVNCADWAFFAKNGNDATSGAIMCARAYTRKKKIIFIKGFYHGVSPWCQKVDYPGIIPEDVENSIYVNWNDIPDLEKAIAENEGEIAAFIAMPYLHGNFFDNILPADGYWQKVRELCTQHGIVLIIDDVRAGFRLDLAGSDHFYGFKADMICFCKAIANGYNVSAICGQEFLKSAMSSLSYTGSYWMSAEPFAAGIACINKMKKLDTPKMFRENGIKLTEGLKKAAENNGFDLVVSGEPALFYLRIANDDSLFLHQEWIAEMVSRGIYLASHHNHFMNASITDEDMERTWEVADDAFKAVRKNHPELF
jgi:glutamate-1-semialdehyde 2,1-aminomutase